MDSNASGGSRSQRDSKDMSSTNATSLPGSPFGNSSKAGLVDDKDKGSPDVPKARPREGKSASFGTGDRLSFFAGTLGKSRKAPPRYSSWVYCCSTTLYALTSALP